MITLGSKGWMLDKLRFIPSLAMLRAFEAFGRLGSTRKAAQAIGIDHAVVSRHLHALEGELGTALVERKSGHDWLTPEGRDYHAQISVALTQLADATDNYRRREQGKLVIWCAAGIATSWLVPRLPDFREQYPEIDLDFRPSDRRVDFSTNEADSEIRYLLDSEIPGPNEQLRTTSLSRPDIFPVASPAYRDSIADRFRRVHDILSFPLLHMESTDYWCAWLGARGIAITTQDIPGQRMWNASLMLNAARHGQGIGIGNRFFVREWLDSGELVRLDPADEPQPPLALGGYHLIARETRWSSGSLSRFRQWLHKQIALAPID